MEINNKFNIDDTVMTINDIETFTNHRYIIIGAGLKRIVWGPLRNSFTSDIIVYELSNGERYREEYIFPVKEGRERLISNVEQYLDQLRSL